MFHSISNHTESFLTASTVQRMVDEYKKIGYKYFVCTDDGLMTSSIKSYKAAEKAGLKFVGGVDIYFRDSNCDIIANTPSDEIKYFKIVLLALDQDAYQKLVKVVSDFSSSIEIDEVTYPLLDWPRLTEISKYNIIASTSAIDDMVTKHLLTNTPKNAVRYYNKLKELFKDNYYPAVTTNIYKQKKTEVVVFELSGGKKIQIPFDARVVTDAKKKCNAGWVANQPNKYKKLLKIEINKILYTIKVENQDIIRVRKTTVFEPLKEDIQKRANQLIVGLANKFGDMDRLVINSNSYYAEKEDNIVQKMKTDGKKPVLISQHIQTQEEIADYLKYMGLNDGHVQLIKNNCNVLFAKFNEFKLNYEYKLVKYDNPEQKLIDLVKSVGRMKWDDVRYTSQFKEEFQLLTQNGIINLIPYFIPIVDVLNHYMENGELVGPARGCLTKDTLVYTKRGVVSLNNIIIGDHVLTHKGNWKIVTDTMRYEVTEELLNIKGMYSYVSNTMTKDHKLYAIKRTPIEKKRENSKEKRWEDWDVGQLEWYRADELKVGDLLFTPWPKDRYVKDIDTIDMSKYITGKVSQEFIEIVLPKKNNLSCRNIARLSGLSKYAVGRVKHSKGSKQSTLDKVSEVVESLGLSLDEWISTNNTRSYKIKRFIKVGKKLCNLIGRWIGDGWITSSHKNSNNWGLCFNTDEVDDIRYYIDYIKELGWDIREKKQYKDKKVVQFTIYNKELCSLFKAIFPNYKYTSFTKSMSFFKNLPDEKLRWVLEGLIGADGHVRKNHGSKHKTEHIDTVSPQLLHDIKESLMALKIPSGVSIREPYIRYQNNKEYKCKKSYKIRFTGITEKRSHHHNFSTNIGYFSPITEINPKKDKYVYDITVQDDSSYTTVDYTVHNSSSGFLISYLIGITHVNPIKYGLHSSRFLTLDRIQQGNLPDIDVDLNSRELLTGKDGNGGYLREQYGNRYAQCSTRTLLRIKSAILDANRYVHGILQDDVVKLSKSLPNTPQGISDYDYIFGHELDGNYVEGLFEKNEDLQKYSEQRPQEWEIVKRALSLSRQNSRHACSFALSSDPIEETVSIMNVGGVERVMQPEPKQIEQAGLIKYDFLTITSALLVGGAIKNINKKYNPDDIIETGCFYHKGEKVFVWDLPDDMEVYQMLHEGKTAGVFQFSSQTMTEFLKKSKPTSILDLSAVNALNRPGPLDFIDDSTGRNMAEEYIERKMGRSNCHLDVLNKLLPETYSVITYQEQITLLAKELANMNVVDSENLRIAVGKKKMKLMYSLKPVFIEGASKKIPKKDAEEIWEMIVTSGRYSFNKSHSVSYSIVSYACAFIKYHYPLEWWASVVSNTSNKKINEEYYKHIKDIVTPPDINKSNDDVYIDYEAGKIRYQLSVISGLGEKTSHKIIENRPYKDLVDFAERSGAGLALSKKLALVGTIDSLFEKKGEEPIINKIYQVDKAFATKARNKKIAEYDVKANSLESDEAKLRVFKNKEKYIAKGLKEMPVDESYLRMDELDIAVMRKKLLPAFPINLTDVVVDKHKDILNMGTPMMYDSKFKEQKIFDGAFFNEIEENLPFNKCVGWIVGYVLECKTFTFSGGTKQAFKIVFDCDGIVKERVIWPDYDTGVLKYNKDIKKGSICALLMYKGEGKNKVNILEEKLLF